MYLSVVTTLYNSAADLQEFYARVVAAADKITSDYEILLVNDGSPDDSLDLALSLYEKDARISVIDLSRNFGHHKAIMTGLSHARGELVFLLDSDLEEEPELLGTFHDELIATGAEVVFGVQQKRKGKFLERVSGTIFFKLFNILSTHSLPPNLVTARLMTRKFVSALLRHQEREAPIAGLWVLTGFRQTPLTIKKHHRGSSTYSLRRRASHFINAITSFSSKPLVFIFHLGSVILVLSCLAALDLLIRRIFFSRLLEGWASLIISIWLMGGLTIFCLGVIGIYLSKIFIEVKQRPYTVIREVYEHKEIPLAQVDDVSDSNHLAQAGQDMRELR